MKKFLFTALKIVLFFIGWAVLIGIIDIPNDNPALWRFFAELTPLIVIVFFTAIFLLIEKKSIKIPLKKNIIKGFLMSLLLDLGNREKKRQLTE